MINLLCYLTCGGCVAELFGGGDLELLVGVEGGSFGMKKRLVRSERITQEVKKR